MRNRFQYLPFTGEEAEAQNILVILGKVEQSKISEPGLKQNGLTLEPMVFTICVLNFSSAWLSPTALETGPACCFFLHDA